MTSFPMTERISFYKLRNARADRSLVRETQGPLLVMLGEKHKADLLRVTGDALEEYRA